MATIDVPLEGSAAIEPVPLTPDHLRAIVAYADGMAHAHYAYAHWLDAHGYPAQATEIRQAGDEACAFGVGATVDLETWNQTQTRPSAASA